LSTLGAPAPAAARTGDRAILSGSAWLSATPSLSPADIDRYREIFALQEAGRFEEATRRIEQVSDRLLIGHVLAQRYLHPKYLTPYSELAQWLEDYGDHVGADKIHRLALIRLPQGRAAPPAPPGPVLPSFLRGGRYIAPDAVVKVASSDFDEGIAAWRAGRVTAAAKHFERVAGLQGAPGEDIAAAALWAARANLRLGKPASVNQWLGRAAEFPHTFYGLIARRQLGHEISIGDGSGDERYTVFDRVLGVPGVQRAIALAEVGERDRALAEIRALYRQADETTGTVLLEIAAQVDAPAEVMRFGHEATLRVAATKATPALFPVPRWEPLGGFVVDRALLFALMRRESGFETGAKSPASASGLMQLMPNTAAFVARDPSFGRPIKGKLDDPRVNLELGQRYIVHLVGTQEIRGNLIHLLAAYNAGPGNLKLWREKLKIEDDPLLFIASVPFIETRGFIEHVLANYWIYASRMGRDPRSLDELAGGKWPLYVDEGTARERSLDYAAD
jgi:soluble lytic murein transglycosylase-like protein